MLDEKRKPEDGTLYADNMQEELAAARDGAALAEAEPIYDDEPVCEGDCAPYSGDLRIKLPAPLALCDPFHDVIGAIPSEADVAAADAAAR